MYVKVGTFPLTATLGDAHSVVTLALSASDMKFTVSLHVFTTTTAKDTLISGDVLFLRD